MTPPAASPPFRPSPLPALRLDQRGRRRIDYRALLALAAPLFINSGVQAVLNLTDTWFLGRISTAATAAVGAVYWPAIVFILVLGGVGIAVQTLAAQAYGAGDRMRAAAVTWSGLWVALAMSPLFFLAGLMGGAMLGPLDLEPEVQALALDYWFPRIAGAVAGVALWVVTSFFNGIGHTGVTLALMAGVAAVNAFLNQVVGFNLGLGVTGIAWATTLAQVLGLLAGLALFLSRPMRQGYQSHRQWRPNAGAMWSALALGLPMGLLPAADLIGLAVFQWMQVDLGTVAGAATQIVMMTTSVAYMPAIGIASAGTTLVGQAIGAGDRDWARKVGNGAIRVTVAYMGLVSLLLALAGSWVLPLFVTPGDPHAAAVVAVASQLIWIAAAYQVFDGFNLGAGFALRGAGDVKVPTLLVIGVSWFAFLPLAHSMTFTAESAWVPGLPQFGLGALGGWIALLLYTGALGLVMWLRWDSGAWRRVELR